MIIVFLIAIFIFLCIFAFVTCNGIQSYVIESALKPGPTILILATTHGNEPAGFYALHRFIDSNPMLKSGKVIIIPSVNTCGRIANTRNMPLGDYDINRNYLSDTFLNREILKFVKDADWVIDLHEGWGFAKRDSGSIGSGIYPGNTRDAINISDRVIKNINMSMSMTMSRVDEYKKFSTMELSNIPGSLRDICNNLNKNYILVETSGINDIQPKELRIKQQLYIIKNIVDKTVGLERMIN